tara:strand:+ start:1830 stop:2189 length:360 start_codon:yes stop_codon:yes gene_type:complete
MSIMKKTILFLAFVFSICTYAQDNKPTFEKVGDMVKATYYHDNGEIAQTGYYKDGKLHGEWEMFDEKGQKVAVGTYDMGKRAGKWLFWEGKMLKEVDFTDNRIASVVQLKDSEGVVIKQ